MGRKTNIPWTDSTWNPIRGCTAVSLGCANCYAARMALRFSGLGKPYHGLVRSTAHGPQWTRKIKMIKEHLVDPLCWREPRRIFVNSMGDLFHEGISFDDIAKVWKIMDWAQHHTFQVLTKRPDRMREFVRWWGDLPPDNLWLGVSAENQEWADKRIPILIDIPATVLFVSCEPLLGAVDLSDYFRAKTAISLVSAEGVTWVVVGGESGSGARRMDLAWARSLRDQCRKYGVPFFFKQKGEILAREMGCSARAGNDSKEWPEDLRIQEFPHPAGKES